MKSLQHRSGFTLIELLVVMAIIGILAAIIFPSVSKVRERAKQTKCLNNARQIASAAVILFGESKEVLPARQNPTAWGEAAAQLLPYVRNVIEVFDCPSNDGILQNTQSAFPAPNNNRYTDYEINGYLCSAPGQVRRQSGITDYSQAAYAYDVPYEPAAVKRAHAGGVNVAYLDGHASFLRDADMGSIPAGGPGDRSSFFYRGHVFD